MHKSAVPFASLGIAGLALAFAVSHPADALPGKNKVDGGDIKNNSVTTADIKNNNLTGKDIKNDSLKGADIKESTLGTVPSAASLTVAPSGSTQSGVFSAGGGSSSGGYIGSPAQYRQPLAAQILDSHIIDTAVNPDPALCPGPGSAAPGYLCLYFDTRSGVGTGYGWSQGPAFPTPSVGATLYFPITSSGSYAAGSWTVTAP